MVEDNEETDKDIEAVQDEKDKHEELKDENVAAGSQTLETILLESDQKGPGLKEDSLKDPDLKKDSTRDHDLKEDSLKDPDLKDNSLKDPDLKKGSLTDPDLQEDSLKDQDLQEDSLEQETKRRVRNRRPISKKTKEPQKTKRNKTIGKVEKQFIKEKHSTKSRH